MSPPLPEAYNSIPFKHIRVSHVPPQSPLPTAVILITLYRPEHYNTFSDTMCVELVNIFNTLSVDSRVRAIVVIGHGHIFCAGADLDSGFFYKNDSLRTHRDGGGKVTLAIHNCFKPVIAAINGSAIGVGITMTLPMAIRVVGQKAKIGFVFARRGIIMEAASSFFLPRLIGHSRAMQLITTGAVYRASDPALSGLFTDIVDEQMVLERALKIAKDISENISAVSWTVMRDLLWRGPSTVEEVHLLDSRIIIELFGSKDKHEGIKSFLDKKQPNFKGKMKEDAPSAWPWWIPFDVSVADGSRKEKSKL